MKQIFLLMLTAIVIGCEVPPASLINSLIFSDTTIPQLEDIYSLDEKKVVLTFSEPVTNFSYISNDNKITNVIESENKMTLLFENNLPIDTETIISLCVKDSSNNALSLTIGVKGKNPNIPLIVINEFLSRGTDTQPNRIEFECHSDGNLAGLYLTNNVKGLETLSFVFPNIDVYKGQYIVLYVNSKPNSDVKNELLSNNVVVLEANLETSFPTTNGMCILYDTKVGNGNILDCIVYISNTASTYSGFGSKEIEQGYNKLVNSGDWFGNAINAEKCTSTRTICRYSGNRSDSNSAFDFYIADTRTSSFGSVNTNKEYKEP